MLVSLPNIVHLTHQCGTNAYKMPSGCREYDDDQTVGVHVMPDGTTIVHVDFTLWGSEFFSAGGKPSNISRCFRLPVTRNSV